VGKGEKIRAASADSLPAHFRTKDEECEEYATMEKGVSPRFEEDAFPSSKRRK
jgi:hypothetical protein